MSNITQVPIYFIEYEKPFYKVEAVEVEKKEEMSFGEKQMLTSLVHNKINEVHPNLKVLEVSTKSLVDTGVSLSAFNLLKCVPFSDAPLTVESLYQGSKKFHSGGPYTDLYYCTPKEAKKDERISVGGIPNSYSFDGVEYPAEPYDAFYNWLYISALLENNELSKKILEYDAFTDIEFDFVNGLNCQAKACAIFVSLAKRKLLEKNISFNEYLQLLYL